MYKCQKGEGIYDSIVVWMFQWQENNKELSLSGSCKEYVSFEYSFCCSVCYENVIKYT